MLTHLGSSPSGGINLIKIKSFFLRQVAMLWKHPKKIRAKLLKVKIIIEFCLSKVNFNYYLK